LNNPVVAVDLDGTLIKGTVLQLIAKECISRSAVMSTMVAFFAFGILKTNKLTRDYMHQNIGILALDQYVNINLQVNPFVIDYLKRVSEHSILVLATGSDQYIADTMCWFFSEYFQIHFDHSIGSRDGIFCVSETKLEALKALSDSFTYMGNSKQDFPLWRDKQVEMICIGDENFLKQARENTNRQDGILLPDTFVYPRELTVNFESNIFKSEFHD